MGNSSNTNSNIKIFIQTQYPFYNSGNIIKGIVHVNSTQNYPYQAIYIRIQGEQKCLWYQGSSKNRRRYYGLNQFFHEDFILEKFEKKMLQKGSYAWPFCIQISQDLPGSFQSNMYDNTYIQYKLKAYLVDYNNGNKIQQFEKPILIRQPFRLSISTLEGQMESTPKSCFCIVSGTTKITATIDKNVYYTDQTIQIQIQIDNQQNQNQISHVQINLLQNLFVTANCGATRTFKKNIHSMMGEGAKRLQNNNYQIQMKIQPKFIEQSTAIGTIVANYFTLQIIASIGGMCRSEEPYVNSVLHIINPRPLDQSPPAYTPTGKQIIHQTQILRCQPFYFRQNKKLAVMNFEYEQ